MSIYEALDAYADSLTGKLKGKKRARFALELLLQERVHLAEEIEEQCKASQNLLTQIRKDARFYQKGDKSRWGIYGPNQGNLGRHVDTLAGVLYGIEVGIRLFYDVLEVPEEQRTYLPTTKEENGGKEVPARQGGSEAEVEESSLD